MKVVQLMGFLLLLFGVAIACSWQFRFKLISESPDRNYRVECRENNNDYDVSCTIYKEGADVAGEIGLYYPKPPPFFREVHPDHQWVTKNILWMGKGEGNISDQSDEILIHNKTTSTISVLAFSEIRKQSLIILDIQPNSVMKVAIQPMCRTASNAPSFFVEGLTISGKTISSEFTEFPNLERYIGGLHFCFTITDESIKVKCRELDGEYNDTEVLREFLSKDSPEKNDSSTWPPTKMKRVAKGDCESSR